jgi:putative FmdB family regulatory protein
MPTYEYQCTNCGSRFELFQSLRGIAPYAEVPCGAGSQEAPV